MTAEWLHCRNGRKLQLYRVVILFKETPVHARKRGIIVVFFAMKEAGIGKRRMQSLYLSDSLPCQRETQREVSPTQAQPTFETGGV